MLLYLDTASSCLLFTPGSTLHSSCFLAGARGSRWGQNHESSQKHGFPGPGCHWLPQAGLDLSNTCMFSMCLSSVAVLPCIQGAAIASQDGDNYLVVCGVSHCKSPLAQKYRIPSPKPRDTAALGPKSSSPGSGHTHMAQALLVTP